MHTSTNVGATRRLMETAMAWIESRPPRRDTSTRTVPVGRDESFGGAMRSGELRSARTPFDVAATRAGRWSLTSRIGTWLSRHNAMWAARIQRGPQFIKNHQHLLPDELERGGHRFGSRSEQQLAFRRGRHGDNPMDD